MNKDLLVIILSYNTKEITRTCLNHLKVAIDHTQAALKSKVRVIVVDNASNDGSLEMLKKEFKWVDLIESKVNTGFSGGNNLAMKQNDNKDFILLLNSDAYVSKTTLVDCLNFFEQHPDCDVLGCRLVFEDGSFQPSAGYLPNPLNTSLWISGLALIPPFNKIYPIHSKDPDFFKNTHQVDWVMGAFMIFKQQVYQKTKGFDQSIFMYGEEVEWAKRIKDAGFKTYYFPNTQVTHLDKASSKFMLEKPLLNEIKGIVRFFKQHYPASYPFIKIIMMVSLSLRIIAFTLLGNSSRTKAYIEGLKVI